MRDMLPIFERSLFKEHFDKYFIIKFPRLDIASKINVIATDKDLKKQIGTPKKIAQLSNDSLLIETLSKAQSEKVAAIKSLNELAVTVEKHKSLNYVKGTLKSDTLTNSTEEEILEVLKNQGVIKVERMKTRRDGNLINTNRYILTFQRTELPPMIQITDWHKELIDLFIPTPMRCLKCQRLGHTKKWCRREEDFCSKCCEPGHKISDCPNNPKCINCKGPHPPSDKQCPHYVFKSEIIATQTREHLTYREAEEKVRDRFVEEGRTFSSVIPNRPVKPNDSSTREVQTPQENRQPKLQTKKSESKSENESPPLKKPKIAARTSTPELCLPKNPPTPSTRPETPIKTNEPEPTPAPVNPPAPLSQSKTTKNTEATPKQSVPGEKPRDRASSEVRTPRRNESDTRKHPNSNQDEPLIQGKRKLSPEDDRNSRSREISKNRQTRPSSVGTDRNLVKIPRKVTPTYELKKNYDDHKVTKDKTYSQDEDSQSIPVLNKYRRNSDWSNQNYNY